MREKTLIAIMLIGMFFVLPLKTHGIATNDLNGQRDTTVLSRQPTLLYDDHGRIEIYNDSAFGASGYGFVGEGNETHPYIIEGLNITSATENLIHIENTTAHFVIQNCMLNETSKSFNGIYLNNVTNGTISNNIIHNT